MRASSLWVGSAAVALAGAAAAATRRSLNALDKAGIENPVPQLRFPAGTVHQIETTDGGSIAVEVTGNGTPGCETSRLGLDIHRVLEHLNLNNVLLVGHSMGGMAAMSYAVEKDSSFDQRVTGLVLVATAARASMAYQRFGLGLLGPLLGIAGHDMPLFRPIASQSMFGRFGSTQLIEAARSSAGEVDLSAIKECVRALGSFDVSGQLGGIKVPTRLVFGSRDTVTPLFENAELGKLSRARSARRLVGPGTC